MMQKQFKYALLYMLLLSLIFPFPACAHKNARAKKANPHPAENVAGPSPKQMWERLDRAVEGLSDFGKRASRYDRDEWNFVLGYAQYSREKWKEADHFFEKAYKKLSLIGDHILFYRAVIANHLDRFNDAVGFLDKLAVDYPDSVWIQDSKLESAKALLGLKRFSAARGLLGAYKKDAKSNQLFEINKLIAESYIGEGNSQRAISDVKHMAITSGGEDQLRELQDLIDEIRRRFHTNIDSWLNRPAQQYRLAQSFVDRSQYDEAAHRLESLIEQGDVSFDLRARSMWLLARCYRWIHQYDKSIALMNELSRMKGGRSYAPGLSYMLATVYAKKDDYEKAISIRKSILKGRSPRSRGSANIAFKIAYLYMDEGKYEKALEYWQRVLKMGPGQKKLTLARWHRAWCYYMLERYDEAIGVLDGLLKKDAKRAKIADRVRYWKARMLLKRGDKIEARKLFKEIKRKYPRGYYAELARRKLSGDGRKVSEFLDVSWNGGLASEWSPSGNPSQGNSVHMKRAEFFNHLGLHEEVARELRGIDLRKHVALADRIMWLASENFVHDLSLRVAKSFRRRILRANPNSSDFDRFVWEQFYPEAYGPVVENCTGSYHVDPILVWSIMRNESAFRPHVVSPAGAVGLMQLMPTTANRLMRESGNGLIDRRELYNPAINITLGVDYLKKLGDMFPGNAVAVIASYNAGEEAVSRWLKNGNMKDIEEWIEEIPYAETNLYVKKVAASYWNYKRLYRN